MVETNCGPKDSNGKRLLVYGSCTHKCPHYFKCCDEIGILPPEHKFPEADATIERMEQGRHHLNYKGQYKIFIKIKIDDNKFQARRSKLLRGKCNKS
jgi:hypothetical protein